MCHDKGMVLVPYGNLGQGRFQAEAVPRGIQQLLHPSWSYELLLHPCSTIRIPIWQSEPSKNPTSPSSIAHRRVICYLQLFHVAFSPSSLAQALICSLSSFFETLQNHISLCITIKRLPQHVWFSFLSFLLTSSSLFSLWLWH